VDLLGSSKYARPSPTVRSIRRSVMWVSRCLASRRSSLAWRAFRCAGRGRSREAKARVGSARAAHQRQSLPRRSRSNARGIPRGAGEWRKGILGARKSSEDTRRIEEAQRVRNDDVNADSKADARVRGRRTGETGARSLPGRAPLQMGIRPGGRGSAPGAQRPHQGSLRLTREGRLQRSQLRSGRKQSSPSAPAESRTLAA
jgi:hypothetical protein